MSRSFGEPDLVIAWNPCRSTLRLTVARQAIVNGGVDDGVELGAGREDALEAQRTQGADLADAVRHRGIHGDRRANDGANREDQRQRQTEDGEKGRQSLALFFIKQRLDLDVQLKTDVRLDIALQALVLSAVGHPRDHAGVAETAEGLPQLLERTGNVVNLASTAGVIGQAYCTAYCASKHAVLGFSRALMPGSRESHSNYNLAPHRSKEHPENTRKNYFKQAERGVMEKTMDRPEITTVLDRVRANTDDALNARIDREIEDHIHYYAQQDARAIARRIDELDREWSIERALETEASSMGLLGLTLGLTVSRKFLLLSAMSAGMMFVHGTQGWYPLLPVFRRLGFRTRQEIDREKYALKALRGDFTGLATEAANKMQNAWQAVRA